MTPSQWEQGRSLDHDRMQADVLEFLRGQPAERASTRKGKGVTLSRIRLENEFMLGMPNGSILSFVDIADFWGETPAKPAAFREILIYEIKPRITSAGAIVRQLKATEFAIDRWLTAEDTPASVRIAPVVMHDDPEVPLLRRLWNGAVLTWNATERVIA